MKVMALDEGETRTSVRQIAMNGNAVFSVNDRYDWKCGLLCSLASCTCFR
jgi:hypothetical protein